LQVVVVDETISVDTLGLVEPQFDEVVWLFNGLWLGDEETLENVGEVAHIKFVVEVERSLTEVLFDLSVKGKSRFDDWSNEFLNGALELAEVLVEEGCEDRV
jgi:hypothetical protein